MLFAAAAAADLGLRTLIAAEKDVDRNRNVATRTIAASRRAVRCLGGGERDPEVFEGEEGWDEGEGEGRGCWVTYGWRRRRLHRLPPLIPSLRRAGSSPWALTRTRTADGRVVVLREPAPRRGRVVATRMDGRLILDLVDSSPVPPPPRQRLAHPSIVQEPDDVPYTYDAEAADEEEEETATGADIVNPRGLDVPATVRAKLVASSSPVGSASPVQAMGCFEAVIRNSPLRKVPVSMPRMVH